MIYKSPQQIWDAANNQEAGKNPVVPPAQYSKIVRVPHEPAAVFIAHRSWSDAKPAGKWDYVGVQAIADKLGKDRSQFAGDFAGALWLWQNDVANVPVDFEVWIGDEKIGPS